MYICIPNYKLYIKLLVIKPEQQLKETDNMNNNIERQTVSEGKAIAIIAYLTIIGFIVAYLLNNDKRNSYAAYHIRQGLGVGLTSIVAGMIGVVPFLGWIAALAVIVLYVIMLITGIITAANGQEKPVMFMGKKFEEWFRTI